MPPVVKRQTESYNVWRSRNGNLISVSKNRVGQVYESHGPSNYNHHSKTKESTDGNVICGGSSQARGVYSGHSAHRTEEVNEITPVDYLNKGHYGMYGPKEPSGHSNRDYLALLNKYNEPTLSRGK